MERLRARVAEEELVALDPRLEATHLTRLAPVHFHARLAQIGRPGLARCELASVELDGLAIKGGATSALEMGSRSDLPIEIDARLLLDGLFDSGLGRAIPVLVQPLRKVGGAHAYRTGELRLRLARLGDSRTHRPAQLRAAHPSDRFGRVRHCE